VSRVLPALAALLALALAGCGGDDDEQPAATPSPHDGRTHLDVEVRPEGADGPVRRDELDELPPGIRPRHFDPVPGGVACTEIYGGPATARVVGVADGQEIDARFSRENGCEIARWDRLEPLLGRAPGPGLPAP
jgi:hypothetical protein